MGDEFLEYCELNKIGKVNKLARETFDRGFTILKYGETPSFLKGNEVIKEVEKEIIKEVEKIIEVEKPIEVIVEKEVYITDDEQVKDLGKKITKLEKDKKGLSQKITALETKLKKKPKKVIKEVINDDEVEKLKQENKKLKEELEKITSSLSNLNKAKYIKNSNLNSLYDE